MTFRVLLFIQPSNSLTGRYILTSPQTITTTFNSSNTNTTKSTNTPTGMNKFMVATDTFSKNCKQTKVSALLEKYYR